MIRQVRHYHTRLYRRNKYQIKHLIEQNHFNIIQSSFSLISTSKYSSYRSWLIHGPYHSPYLYFSTSVPSFPPSLCATVNNNNGHKNDETSTSVTSSSSEFLLIDKNSSQPRSYQRQVSTTPNSHLPLLDISPLSYNHPHESSSTSTVDESPLSTSTTTPLRSSSNLSHLTGSSEPSLCSTVTSTVRPTISETEIHDFIKQISKDEKLLKFTVSKGMSPKSKKRWIQALIQQLELDLINGTSVNDGVVSSARTTAEAQQQDSSAPPSSVADFVQSCSSIPSAHKEKADQVFRILDINQDGYVGLREFRIWFSTYYLNRGNEQSARIKASVESTKLKNQTSNLIPQRQEQSSENTKEKTTDDSISDITTFEALGMQKIQSSSLSDNARESSNIELINQEINEENSTNIEPSIPVVSPVKMISESGAKSENDDVDDDDDEDDVQWKSIVHVMIRSSIPYLAFGIIDNGFVYKDHHDFEL